MTHNDIISKTTELMVQWTAQHFQPMYPDEYWSFDEDINLNDKGMIRAAEFLLNTGVIKNIGGTGIAERKLVLELESKLNLPDIDDAFKYFIWIGGWRGFMVKHPYEGFLADLSVDRLFRNLVKLEYCTQEGLFYFWTEKGRMTNTLNTDVLISNSSESIPDFQNNPRVWGNL